MDNPKKEICGIVEKVFYANNGWASFTVQLDKRGRNKLVTYQDVIRCSGKCNVDMNSVGMTFTGYGYIKEDKKYGTSYDIEEGSSELKFPETTRGIRRFLASGAIKHIGEISAQRIVDEFGDDTINVIKNNPEKLKKVLNDKQYKSLVQNFEKYIMQERIFELTNGEITLNEVKKILDTYGKKSEEILKTHPYYLCDISGFGFLKVDRIALGLKIDPFSFERLVPAIEYALDAYCESKGHCFIKANDLLVGFLRLVNPISDSRFNFIYDNIMNWEIDKINLISKYRLKTDDVEYIERWLRNTKKYIEIYSSVLNQGVCEKRIVMGNGLIESAKNFNAERQTAIMLVEKLQMKPLLDDQKAIEKLIQDYEKNNNFQFAPEQKAAVIKSTLNKCSIITGGPGRGKTTIIKAIINCLETKTDEIYLLAPTGRAAQRIKESSGYGAFTIHKFLTYLGDKNFGEENRANVTDNDLWTLDEDDEDSDDSNLYKNDEGEISITDKTVIIIDECSMIDMHLIHRLLKRIEKATVIFIGDADQLAPVGIGSFFKDAIASNIIPTTRLIQSYRNGGTIAHNSDKVNACRADLQCDDHFQGFLSDSNDNLADYVVKQYMHLHKDQNVSLKDICILTLQNAKGAVCTQKINEMLQEKLNPKTKDTIEVNGFRINDRVMQTRNNYRKVTKDKNGVKALGIFNGDVGVITNIKKEDGEWQVEVLWDDDRTCKLKSSELSELKLAYAITVHKSQGSEYKYVIFTVSSDMFTMFDKTIIYTAITRAKEKVICIANKKAFFTCIKTAAKNERYSNLKNFLNAAVAQLNKNKESVTT